MECEKIVNKSDYLCDEKTKIPVYRIIDIDIKELSINC